MKRVIYFLSLLICIKTYSQNTEKLTKPIIEEGKRLYKSEMSSWHGTDLFLSKYQNRDNIGGYFSYTQNDENINVFFSKSETPKIIGTIKFDDTFNLEKANIDLTERYLTQGESEIYLLRNKALNIIQNDTIFKTYQNTNLNLIPLIDKKENKVYVLTGPSVNGVIIFGNDYLLTFDKKNNLKSAKALHKNIIPINYKKGDEVEMTMHSHLPDTGDFITATDICTLMLYGKATGWKQHNVISKNYMSIWNINTDNLFVLTMDAVKKINEYQEKRIKEREKSPN
ncbi:MULTISPECIES: hypothetical protein [Empedobacter]|uniref:Uncharacterized protein n=1 Tax=Empedobacter falsenii TaxID=343874 RepID=A0A7H9DUD6_9FLAO|nr:MULTISPECIES: hypothetical protein [Empedobacter]MDH2206474.1 hypothetical protein [Empedobacter sp. GD03644]QLL58316.1 hypothetical protein FH779_09555 [Empedobacter falsenii]